MVTLSRQIIHRNSYQSQFLTILVLCFAIIREMCRGRLMDSNVRSTCEHKSIRLAVSIAPDKAFKPLFVQVHRYRQSRIISRRYCLDLLTCLAARTNLPPHTSRVFAAAWGSHSKLALVWRHYRPYPKPAALEESSQTTAIAVLFPRSDAAKTIRAACVAEIEEPGATTAHPRELGSAGCLPPGWELQVKSLWI